MPLWKNQNEILSADILNSIWAREVDLGQLKGEDE